MYRKIRSFVYQHLPEPTRRLILSYIYNKQNFLLKKSDNAFDEIYSHNKWSSSESRSGGGSTIEGTKTIRNFLQKFLEEYKITSMLDVPCGDYNWMNMVQKDCHYIGGDIVPALIAANQQKYGNNKVEFRVIDISKDQLPKVDLIFCKDCLQHISNEKVWKALHNFKKSGSKWLLVTSYPLTIRNHDIFDGDYRPLNLFKKPFSLKDSILSIKEESRGIDIEIDKTMYLFDLQKLNLTQPIN